MPSVRQYEETDTVFRQQFDDERRDAVLSHLHERDRAGGEPCLCGSRMGGLAQISHRALHDQRRESLRSHVETDENSS
jgi:hypothetical protein